MELLKSMKIDHRSINSTSNQRVTKLKARFRISNFLHEQLTNYTLYLINCQN